MEEAQRLVHLSRRTLTSISPNRLFLNRHLSARVRAFVDFLRSAVKTSLISTLQELLFPPPLHVMSAEQHASDDSTRQAVCEAGCHRAGHVESSALLNTKLARQRCKVVVELIESAGTDQDGAHRRLPQHPCQRHLGGATLHLGGDFAHHA